MEDFEQLKQNLKQGRISLDQLLEIISNQQQQLDTTNQQLKQTQEQLKGAQEKIQELEKKLVATAIAKVDEPYSMRSEEKRQEERGKQKPKPKLKVRRGRLRSADKIALASRTEKVLPDGVPEADCRLSHTRPVWRLKKGKAVLVAYEIYRGPGDRYGQIPGVLGRSEYGVEVVAEIAYLVHVIGLSFDRVCKLLEFFQNLPLKKSQVDALLHRLSRHWEAEFETLCALLANSAVVHADETSWSINSVWAFLSEKARVVLYGVHKDAATLMQVLDPATFEGIVVSDHAAVYETFTQAQKCWAHLLRKAIKLTLHDPLREEFRTLTDQLLEIYRKGCRIQRDGRLSDPGRAAKVLELEDQLFKLLLGPYIAAKKKPSSEDIDGDYRRLVNEIMELMLKNQLFTFVLADPVVKVDGTTEPVAGTNNEAERTLRNPAQARDTGRTDKKPVGARRRTILVSVLESLRLYLPTFTLASIVAELQRWWKEGRSCFRKAMENAKLQHAKTPVIDRVIPIPSG